MRKVLLWTPLYSCDNDLSTSKSNLPKATAVVVGVAVICSHTARWLWALVRSQTEVLVLRLLLTSCGPWESYRTSRSLNVLTLKMRQGNSVESIKKSCLYSAPHMIEMEEPLQKCWLLNGLPAICQKATNCSTVPRNQPEPGLDFLFLLGSSIINSIPIPMSKSF